MLKERFVKGLSRPQYAYLGLDRPIAWELPLHICESEASVRTLILAQIKQNLAILYNTQNPHFSATTLSDISTCCHALF